MGNSVFSESTAQFIRQYLGEESYESLLAESNGALMAASPDFAKYSCEYLLADIMARPGLPIRERSMIIISVMIANRYESVSNSHMRWALNVGITQEEVLEIVIQASALGNWPRGGELLDLFERAYPGYLKTVKENPFCKAISQTGLTVREKSLITMGALIARRFGERLQEHMRYALSIGITQNEILETIMQVTPFVGWPSGVDALSTAKEIFGPLTKINVQNGLVTKTQQTGRHIIRQLSGGEENDELFTLIGDVFPDFMNVVTEGHLFGKIWSRPLLSLRDRSILTIAILIAGPTAPYIHLPQCSALKSHMRYAVNAGLTIEEILEVILQSGNYTCWGSGVQATRAAGLIFESEQKEKSPKYSSRELQKKGKHIIEKLHGGEAKDEFYRRIEEVCPDFMKVITEQHLFGEVWSRPGLELRDRCLVALAIFIAGRFGVELKAHIGYALNIGLSREEILEIILHTANYTCWDAGGDAIRASIEIFEAGSSCQYP